MVERTDGRPHKYIAQLDPKLCVACGICIGTCQPLAISLGNNPPEPLWKQTIARVALPGESPLKVVFACERHAFQGGRAFLDASTVGGQPAKEDDQRVMLVPLTCIGMLHPDLIGQTIRAGAEQVEIVGCPPEDCANREGNLWIQQRLDRNRLPKLRLAFAQAAIRSNWLSPLRFRKVFQGAARQGLVTAYEKGRSFRDWQSFLPVFVLLAGVLGLQVLLTSVPLRIYTEQPAYLQIALEHQVGNAILGAQQPVTTAYQNGLPARLVVELDDRAIFDRTYQRDLLYIFEQIRLDPGNHTLRILLFDSTGHNDAQILFARSIEISAGEIFPLDFIDAPMAGNPAAGEKIYNETSVGTNAGCRICHSLEPGVTLVGPSFAGVASRAAIRVPGQTAEEYLRQSILEPDAYVVSGFPAGLMVPNLDEKLTPQQINDLLAFLLTLK
jgi:coenzyme F420-reducing hydrogenase delta subunit